MKKVSCCSTCNMAKATPMQLLRTSNVQRIEIGYPERGALPQMSFTTMKEKGGGKGDRQKSDQKSHKSDKMATKG